MLSWPQERRVQGSLVSSWAASWNVRPLLLVSSRLCIFSAAFHVRFLLTACRKSFLGHNLPISWSFPLHIVSVWGWIKSAVLEKACSLLHHSLSPLWSTRKAVFLDGGGRGGSSVCVSLQGSLTQTCFCVWKGACVCMCFPLPNGHFHLWGPDGVLGAVNNGVEIQSCLSKEAVVTVTGFPSSPLPHLFVHCESGLL